MVDSSDLSKIARKFESLCKDNPYWEEEARQVETRLARLDLLGNRLPEKLTPSLAALILIETNENLADQIMIPSDNIRGALSLEELITLIL